MHGLSQVDRILDGATDTELARADLRVGGARTGMVVTKVHLVDGSGKMRGIGAPIQSHHPVEAAPKLTPMLWPTP